MGLMFTNNPLGHDYNEPMVDRLLGKAYQTIKEVHESLPDIAQAIAVGEDSKKVTASVDKLTATLKGFKEGTGLFIGHDLGEVGVEDSKDTYIGDNFLSELTKSGTNVKTVGDNVSTINRLAEHINELKAIAEALTSLLTVKDSLNEVDTINQNIEKIKTVANNSSNINSVYDCLDNINALAGSINDFPELIEHGEDIATVAQHISYVVTLGSNIVGFHNRIVSLETATDNLDKRLTAAEELNTSQSESIADHEKRIGNIETTTDVGQISVRIQAIEDKNVEQDTALDNETKARVAKEKLLDAKDTELTNALADEQQAREQKDTSLETKNTEQDNRLDAIETKNTAQDTALASLSQKLQANYVTLNTEQEITAKKTFSASELEVKSPLYPDNGLVLNVTGDGGGIILQSNNYCLKADVFKLDETDDTACSRLFIGDKIASKAIFELRLYRNGALTWNNKPFLFVPDYSKQIIGDGVDEGTWVTCDRTSFVILYGARPFTSDFEVHMQSPSGGDFVVAAYYNDTNSNTRGCSFSFIVPAGWRFVCPWANSVVANGVNKNRYRIYPMTYVG